MAALIKVIKRLEYANFLIRKRATGDLETFARKMKLSTRSIKSMLFEMRELGAKIKYDRNRKTYYYEDDGEFCISKYMRYGQILTREEMSNIGKPDELCFSEKATFVICDEN